MGLLTVYPITIISKTKYVIGVLLFCVVVFELFVKPMLAQKKEKGQDLGFLLNSLMRPEEMREHSGKGLVTSLLYSLCVLQLLQYIVRV